MCSFYSVQNNYTQTEWIAGFDFTPTFCLIRSSLLERQVEGCKKPRAEPWACQQKELVFPPKHDARKIFSRYNPSHGKASLQENLIASSVAEVPCISMKDIFSTLTAEVCILIHDITFILAVHHIWATVELVYYKSWIFLSAPEAKYSLGCLNWISKEISRTYPP